MKRSFLGRVRIAIILLCLILIAGIIGYAILSDTNNEVLDKDQIQTNLENYGGEDLGYTYVSSYVKKYGIGNIDIYKLNYIETQLENDFYRELPSEYDLAQNICDLYLQYFYDKVDKTDQEAVTDAIVHCFLASLEDRYAYYRTAEEFEQYLSSLEGGNSFVGIGVMVDSQTLKVSMVYHDSGAAEAGIKHGDIIYGVEGKTLDDATPDELTALLRGEEGTTVNVTIKRGDEFINLTVTRKKLTEQSVSYEIDKDNIGYIYISQFLESTDEQFAEAVDFCTKSGAVALIIDVRYNPGGLLDSVVNVIDYLVPDANNRVIATYSHGKNSYTYTTKDGHGVNIPIAVICNGGTASAGELFTAAMRDFAAANVIEAIVVGTQTYGKVVVQTSYSLYDGSGLTYTVGYYNPPCGINYDGVGIIPDFEVADTQETDVALNKAKTEILNIVYKNGAKSLFVPAA